MTFKSGKRRSPQPEGAPGDLGLVQAFVNTENRRQGTDRLQDSQGLAEWLVRAQLLAPDTASGDGDLELAHELRRSLRRLCAVHNGAPPSPEASAALDRAARDTQLSVRYTAEGEPYVTAAADGVAGALGRLLSFVSAAHADGLWNRLKTCADPKCAAAFYDHSSNQSARWCTPRCCNRVNARATQRRR